MKEYKAFSKNGTLIIDGFYDSNNLKTGIWKEYDSFGNLIIEEVYFNGKRNGLYKSFYINANLWCIGSFKNGVKEGEFKIYKEDGSIFKIQTYQNDLLISEK